MDAHIIPNFVSYLPALTDGLKLLTQTGTIVIVTIKGNDFYLNNAKIIASNLILENGGAHVLNQVCLPFLIVAHPFTRSRLDSVSNITLIVTSFGIVCLGAQLWSQLYSTQTNTQYA